MDKYLNGGNRTVSSAKHSVSTTRNPRTVEPERVVEEDVIGSFLDFDLVPPLLEALSQLGHEIPTPIQRKAIKPALAGRDVLGCAQTGTGKTGAFTLPLLQRLSSSAPSRSDDRGQAGRSRGAKIRALVLSPTRELAAQIDENLGHYGKYCRLKHAMVCGGVGMGGQIQMLRRGIDVLVATPGRLEDLMSQGIIDLSGVEVLVLDEVDRMLDQGFLPAVRRITAKVPASRQTLLFSATMPPELRKLALVLMSNPVEVAVDVVASTPDSIEQVVYHVAPQMKRMLLEHLVGDEAMSRVLVFTRTKHGADRVAKHLKAADVGAEALHGGKTQSSRERALSGFRDGRLRVLVATDLAARGIHVDGISHVINFDLPVDADNYVHRIGRTARAGAKGKALSLCSDDERDVLRRIEKLIRQRLPVEEAPRLHPVVERQTAGVSNRPRPVTEHLPRSRPNLDKPSASGAQRNSFGGFDATRGRSGGFDAARGRSGSWSRDGHRARDPYRG